jgi:hypothetical protein
LGVDIEPCPQSGKVKTPSEEAPMPKRIAPLSDLKESKAKP